MKITPIVVLIAILSLACSKSVYDQKKSYVTQLTNFNFKDQVTKIRQNTNYVSIVHFFKDSDGKSADIAQQLCPWTDQYNGIFRVGAVDCVQYPKICSEEGVTEFPTIKVYPPLPMPAFNIQNDFSPANIQKRASKYLHSNAIEITNSNLQTFLNENPSVPKVFLFTDKKGVPSLYKGLSVAFEKKLNFGVVRSTDDILVSKYGIKQFPSIIVVKTGQKKHIPYKGTKFTFRQVFEFLNIYSQVFVPGGGSSLDSSATKQWMTEIFPEMYAKSAKDICLGIETLCVILITKQKPSKDMTLQFEELNTKFDRKIDRGAKFKFMWLNANVQKAWASMFNYAGDADQVVILNAGKRKRYTPHEGPINKDSVGATLDAISGGDARFNRISEFPPFEVRAQ